MQLPRFAAAQRTVAVIHGDLRHRAKDGSTDGWNSDQTGRENWNGFGAHETGEGSIASHRSECAIRGRDQSPRECDSFRLIAIEQRRTARLIECSGQFPSKIHRIADAGVHSLAADRAMDMRGVAQQERSTLAKLLRDAMMNAVGRKPIHLLYFNPKIVKGSALHVFKFKMLVILRHVIAHRTDQTRSAALLQREHREKVRIIEVDVQFAIHGRSGSLDIRNKEQMVVGSTGESRAEDLSHPGAGAVAAGEIRKGRYFLDLRLAQGRVNFAAAILEIGEFRLTLDFYAERTEALDQQRFMLVLRKNNGKWKGGEAFSQVLERNAGGGLGFDP